MEEVNENGSKSADGKSVTIKPKDSASIVLGLSLIFFVFIIIYMWVYNILTITQNSYN